MDNPLLPPDDDTDPEMGVPEVSRDCSQKACHDGWDNWVSYHVVMSVAGFVSMMALKEDYLLSADITLIVLAAGHILKPIELWKTTEGAEFWYHMGMAVACFVTFIFIYVDVRPAFVVLAISTFENVATALCREQNVRILYWEKETERAAEISRRQEAKFDYEWERQTREARRGTVMV